MARQHAAQGGGGRACPADEALSAHRDRPLQVPRGYLFAPVETLLSDHGPPPMAVDDAASFLPGAGKILVPASIFLKVS